VSEDFPSSPGGFAVGSQIAGYRLLEQIGRGGMAVVYRAHDERLDRQVALKILAPGLALDDAFRQRFIRESRAAAAVDDPHIIPVFEAGESGGVLFIAMRYVRGGDVRTLLDRHGPLPPARATEIISQVASALDDAHSRGLVHRDVKPANMLLDAGFRSDRPDHVYLSDFGLSKQSLAPSGLTSTGQFLGTLDYVAPEQIEGKPVDGRADLYSLACAAFELLSGEPPFKRDQGLAVVYAQLSEPPPSLSARRPGLPPAAGEVIARAMAKAPADRFASCRDFAAALRAAFGLRPLDSGPEPIPGGNRPPTEVAFPVPQGHGAADPGSPRAAGPDPVPGRGTAAPLTSADPVPAGAPAGPVTQAARVPAGRTTPGAAGPPHGPAGSAGPPDYGQPAAPRHRSRKTAAAAAAAAAIIVIGGGAYLLLRGGSGSGSSAAGNGLAPPGCTTKTASARALPVRSAQLPVGGNPFAVKVSRGGQFSFVSTGKSVAMLNTNGGGLNLTIRTTIVTPGGQKGEAITGNGYLLVAGNSGATVISIKAAKQGAASPVVGNLRSPGGKHAAEVMVSPDDNFAFVTLQGSNKMAVFNLKAAQQSGFRSSGFVGFVRLGDQPVGMTEHGGLIYATSMQRGPGKGPAEGTVSVISMARAEHGQQTAVLASAAAGCAPSRVMTSPDGSIVWVTTQQSNALLAFSAAALRTDPPKALMARVLVGPNPIGETFIKGGSQIVVANADNSHEAAPASLMVVNTSAALKGRPAVLGYIRTGKQPRQFDLEGGKTLLVTNTGSGQLQAVDIASIP
jgi:serine/threonine-protein kinase